MFESTVSLQRAVSVLRPRRFRRHAVVACAVALVGCAPTGPSTGRVVETIEVVSDQSATPATDRPLAAEAEQARKQVDDTIAAVDRRIDEARDSIASAARPATVSPDPQTAKSPGGNDMPAAAVLTPVASALTPTSPAAGASAADRGPRERVALGDPMLTAGVPGAGPITEDQIDAWLERPENFVELEPVLPLGLAAGAAQITGLDANPLTRAKIELGRQLYFDTRLSADATVSCASCHDPAAGYSAHTKTGVGIRGQLGGRNSPVSYNRILSGRQFWDGRVDSLEAQAVGPIQNPTEMGFTHEGVVKRLTGIPAYRKQFEKIFGELTIDRVGQAIAAFERVLVTEPSPYDYEEQWRPLARLDADDLADDADLARQYAAAKAASESHPLSESARRGREIFFTEKGSCTACHVGANLADEQYHNLGIGMDKPQPDLGRFVVTKDEKDTGAFKTPTVRNVVLSAPYMHDGSLETLAEVVEWYDKGGHANPHLSEKIRPLHLSAQDKADLVAFLEACTGPTPPVETGRLPADAG